MLTCTRCGCPTPRRGPGQRYCPRCSEQRDLERKRLWARQHPPCEAVQQRNIEHQKRARVLVVEASGQMNAAAKSSIAWRDGQSPDLLWCVRIGVPFSYAASKNHIYAMRRSGHVALRREVVAMRQMISRAIRGALGGRRIAHHKLWVDLLVQKPNHRGDAVNVVDLVCDAIQDATGLDDRWYAIRALDWEIVKSVPKLFIGIGQESDIDSQVCSHCGQVKPLADFTRRASAKLGVGRACRECLRAGRALAKNTGGAPS